MFQSWGVISAMVHRLKKGKSPKQRDSMPPERTFAKKIVTKPTTGEAPPNSGQEHPVAVPKGERVLAVVLRVQIGFGGGGGNPTSKRKATP